jgi:hypothetical protein
MNENRMVIDENVFSFRRNPSVNLKERDRRQ